MTTSEISRHEAAHAAAACFLGIGVRSVSLTDGSGSTALAALDRSDQAAIRKALIVLCVADAMDES